MKTGRLGRVPSLVMILLLLVASVQLAGGQRKLTEHVVVISIDGLLPEYYLRPGEFGLSLPNLESLRKAGSWAWAVVGQYPSVTCPSHTSIVTGVRPATHGIVHNTIFDPARGSRRWYRDSSAIRVPTLWSLARSRGIETGAVSWPVTLGSEIDYLIPEAGPPPQGMGGFEYIRSISTPGLAEAIVLELGLKVVEYMGDPAVRDRLITAAAVHILRNYRPGLMLIHLIHTDSAQHRYGKHAPKVIEAFESTDARIGEIIRAVDEAGIRPSTTFFVVGDHGFYQVHSALQPNVILRREGLLETDSGGRIAEWEAATHRGAIRLKDPSDRALARRVEDTFRKMADGPYRGLFQVVDRQELDALGAYPEAVLMLEPVEGYLVSAGFEADQFIVPTAARGAHGYLPTRPAMHTGLIASGPGIRKGVQVPLARQIDIAPTVASLLGLEMADIEGAAMVGILELGPKN